MVLEDVFSFKKMLFFGFFWYPKVKLGGCNSNIFFHVHPAKLGKFSSNLDVAHIFPMGLVNPPPATSSHEVRGLVKVSDKSIPVPWICYMDLKGQILPRQVLGWVILGIGLFRLFFLGMGGGGEKGHPWNKQFAPARLRHPKKESSSFSKHPFSGVSTRCFMRILRIFSQMPPLKIRPY